MDCSVKMQGSSALGLRHYMEALEVEKLKIQVFQRELPLSLELVNQAIERCKQLLSKTTTEYLHIQSECSEQTSGEEHVFEEFIPIRRTVSTNDEAVNEHSHKANYNPKEKNVSNKKKSDWLRSVQLWNPNPDPLVKEEMPRKESVELKKNNGGAFRPFQREKSVGKTIGSVSKASPSVPATSSSAEMVSGGNGGSDKREEEAGQSQRKQRRNWSPELHRRFLNALQQLGGIHATPKQIRDMMKVEGLTNDEVKSHLQKYRLHTRRPSEAIPNNGSAQAPQGPQLVVMGGLWVSSPAEASNVGPATGIYAPMAMPPATVAQAGAASVIQRQEQKPSESSHSNERVSHSERGVHSNSPSTSSSTHVMTTSSGF